MREAEPRDDGYRHIDTPALIAKLQDLHVNTYVFGIWDSPTDWEDLCDGFIAAAEEAGIYVWVYVVPPTETCTSGRGSRPFGTDYLAWARAIAALSLQHPNLTAWAIDDFEFNQAFFTVEYVRQVRKSARAVNPKLAFFLCTYLRAATDHEFLDKYGPFLDGLLYPFLDGHNMNTQVAASVDACLDAIIDQAKPRELSLVLLVYSGRFLDAALSPTEDYVSEVLGRSLRYLADGSIQGVTAYGVQLDDAPTVASENQAMYGRGRLSLAVPGVSTVRGACAEASQQVTVDPTAKRQELSFWHSDVFAGRRGTGEHVKQILIDDEVVWSSPVAGHPRRQWLQGHPLQGPIDLTAHLRGKLSARLTLRLVDPEGTVDFPVDVGFDHLESIGFALENGDFEVETGWDLRGSGGAVAKVDLFVPDRPMRIFRAVSDRYAQIAAHVAPGTA